MIWSEPSGKAVVLNVAVSGENPESAAVLRVVDPLDNVTVPVGGAPERDVCTVAVNDTNRPDVDGTAG